MIQLLREWPPGFGGVERFAHEIATEVALHGESLTTLSLVPLGFHQGIDPLDVNYPRFPLWSFDLARLRIPIPHPLLLQIVFSSQPLLIHLPCPTIALLAWFAVLWRPNRRVWVVWHAFLENRSLGHRLYHQLLRILLPRCTHITTTSPVLALSLAREFCGTSESIRVLPCVLPESSEQFLLRIGDQRLSEKYSRTPYTLACIGRLDSYKRVDWVVRAFADSPANVLEIVGEGPLRSELENLARELQLQAHQTVIFHGRLDESAKRAVLSRSHLLVLASDSCHEAFGIVQLEAMAAAVPSISFDLPNSGMAWVNGMQIPPFLPMRSQSDLLTAIRFFADPERQRSAALFAQHRYKTTFARDQWSRELEYLLAACSR